MSEAADLIERWQHWAPDADPCVNVEVGMISPDDPDEPCFAKLYGIIVGDTQQIATQEAQLRRALGPLANALRVWQPVRNVATGYLAGLIDHQGQPAWQPSRPYPGCGFQFTRSDFHPHAFDREAVVDCVRQFEHDRRYAQFRELEFIPWGGAYAGPNPDACFAHRDSRCLVRHTVMLGARADAALRQASADWVDDSQRSLGGPIHASVYQGYADPRLLHWADAYYGDSYARLQQIKRDVDPDDVFRHPQSIRLPSV
jgi:FAD/FMN-containing dehydrogenase